MADAYHRNVQVMVKPQDVPHIALELVDIVAYALLAKLAKGSQVLPDLLRSNAQAFAQLI
jgi:hypothetical protein